MKLIKPSFEIIEQQSGLDGLYKQIKLQNKKSRLHYDDFGFAPGEHLTQNEKFVSRWGEPQYIESQYLDNAKTALIHPVPLNVVECDEINEKPGRSGLSGFRIQK